MSGITDILRLGYMIQSIWQVTPREWWVCFRSPFEWETWQAKGSSLAEAATNAALIARKRGPALEASVLYRARVAADFVKKRTKGKRVRLEQRRTRVKL